MRTGTERQLLSRLIGCLVLTSSGAPLGRLRDLTVLMGPPEPPVHRLVVRATRKTVHVLDWTSVADVGPGRLRLLPSAQIADPTATTSIPLEPAELLLARDVLDTEVVDLKGHRLSRVSEVLLLETGGEVLRLVAVDVGIRPLLRRIGPRWLRPARDSVLIRWADLHLTSHHGHLVQLSTATAGFRTLSPHGLAELASRLSTEKASDMLQAVSPRHAAAAVHTSDPLTGGRLLGALPGLHRKLMIDAADPAHADHLRRLVRRAKPASPRRLLRTAGWRIRRPRRTPSTPPPP